MIIFFQIVGSKIVFHKWQSPHPSSWFPTISLSHFFSLSLCLSFSLTLLVSLNSSLSHFPPLSLSFLALYLSLLSLLLSPFFISLYLSPSLLFFLTPSVLCLFLFPYLHDLSYFLLALSFSSSPPPSSLYLTISDSNLIFNCQICVKYNQKQVNKYLIHLSPEINHSINLIAIIE